MFSRRDVLKWSALSMAPVCVRPSTTWAADAAFTTNVLAAGQKPTDARLGPPKTLNDYFPFPVPQTAAEWAARRQAVREQVLVATGLWPLPDKTPLNPVVHGAIERDGYTVEKVFFASMPGHYVCGNLYKPAGKPATGKWPAILSPHGHWLNGRFYEAPDAEVAKQMKSGAEATKEGAKYPLQARCAMLARLGFVVFHYDMVGYADSTAIKHIARSGVPHPEGFADANGELRLQSLMGLQTWNSVRALDFIESLPDVDAKKIGVTGASGGGTQTFVLCAVDDRPAAAFPAVMVSTAMQGGCVCENCSYLRVGTGNVELAALFAPKPLAMSGADDWTKEIMTKGFPELKKLYALAGAPENVAAQAWTQFPHNYNQVAREFMYSWFSKHLLGKDDKIAEKPFTPVPPKDLTVFDAKHARPADEVGSVKLREAMTKASDTKMAALAPTDEKSLAEFRRVVGTALRVMVNDTLPVAGTIEVHGLKEDTGPGGLKVHKALLGRKGSTDAVPAIGCPPAGFDGNVAVLWLHPQGKASLVENGDWAAPVKALHQKKIAVLGIDAFQTGEQVGPKPFPVNATYAGFTYGYNRSVLANQVRDALTAIAFLRDVIKAKAIHVVGWGAFGPAAVLARALAGPVVTKLAADLNQFRFETLTDPADPMMLPGAGKYGGLPAFLALCAPGEVLAHNHKGTATGKLSKAAYAAAGAADKLTRAESRLDPTVVTDWLVKG
ncbi:acetylxylan esterase [Fimbriiglobus ruber]|uniref:Uncharacterized protein n=1 Tax=Fimbriiglobus ruber TaxID=1908690 RepID=A0A225DJ12_9BACT|nr:acetylxylan esterase [Fimbriiglobus ruber]OWK36365.1 hypothetical protein FRUB_08928 [Fimbriiglobus ruber]